MTIKEQCETLYKEMRRLEEELKSIQGACSHPKFVEGLSIVACIQSVLLCEDCGYAKPIEYPITSYNDGSSNYYTQE